MESSKEVFFDINFNTFIASEEIRGDTFYGNIKLIQRDLIPYGAKMNRKRVFEIIEKSDGSDHLSSIYDVLMIIVIVLSLIPLDLLR